MKKRGLTIGIVVGLTVAIIMIITGLAAAPFTFGSSSVLTVVGLKLLFVILTTSAWASCFKYAGRSIDVISDIKKTGKTTNQKLAALGGCIAGIALSVVMICFPVLKLVTSPLVNLANAARLLPWEKISLFAVGIPGFCASSADKIGHFVDCFTPKTIIDGFKFIKNKAITFLERFKTQKEVANSEIVLPPSEIAPPVPIPSLSQNSNPQRALQVYKQLHLPSGAKHTYTVNDFVRGAFVFFQQSAKPHVPNVNFTQLLFSKMTFFSTPRLIPHLPARPALKDVEDRKDFKTFDK